jgi:hypothetical protein
MTEAAKLPAGAKGSTGVEICRAFRNNGKCRFDKDCKYEHSTGAVIDAPPRDYTPKGDCHNWTDHKECRFGERCRFLHGAEDKRTTYRVSKPANTSGEQEVCRNFQNRGKCRFENCKHKHVEGAKKPAGEKKSGGAAAGAGAGGEGNRRRRRRKAPGAAGGAGASGGRASGERKEAKNEVQYDKDGVECCRNFIKGKCKLAAGECQYSHNAPASSAPGAPRGERKKREPKECNQFAEGKCEYGSECRFKHGANDTRDLGAIRTERRRQRDAERTDNKKA